MPIYLPGQTIISGRQRRGTVLTNIIAQYDPDAQAFFTAASITDNTQKSAVNQLVLDLKSNSLWTLVFALYPYVGGAATPHSYNLKNPASYQITWNGTVVHNSNGIAPDGITGYGNTGLIVSSVLTASSAGCSEYYRSLGGGSFLGDFDLTSNFGIQANVSPTTSNFDINFSTTRMSTVMGGVGLYAQNRTSTSSAKGYYNGTSGVSASTGLGTFSAASLLIGKLGVSANYSSAQIAMTAVHAGMSDAQATAFYNAVQAFQTTLGRNV